ncbi:MAG: ABC transporter substrate-binding protein, partial [Candidatus Sericytochromatia bacterium]|nr:ABC transporter substrate-binding protein [Candidatus Sericytochromatia bacterium]
PLTTQGGASGQPLQKVGLSLQWLPQAQFAGFYVARDKGFFAKEGIDLQILPYDGAGEPFERLLNGQAALHVTWASQFLHQRGQGQPIVGIMQVIQRSNFLLMGKKSEGITAPADLAGRQVGAWPGFETQTRALLDALGVGDSATLVPQPLSMAPFVDGTMSVASAMRYNEYNLAVKQLESQSLDPTDLTVFNAADYGLDVIEDTLTTLADTLGRDRDLAVRMVRASLAGWAYAMAHPDEAIDILMQADPGLDRDHQTWMMQAIADTVMTGKAQSKGVGYIDLDRVAGEIGILTTYGLLPAPIEPAAAYDTSIWQQATGRAGIDDRLKEPPQQAQPPQQECPQAA